jgi:hypothetical protein
VWPKGSWNCKSKGEELEEGQGNSEKKICIITELFGLYICYAEWMLLILNLQLYICVAVEMNLTNRVGEILGFGETIEDNTTMPCSLQRAYIQIFTNRECKESELPSNIPNPRVLCAGVIGGGVDSCQVGQLVKLRGLCSNDGSYSSSRQILSSMEPEVSSTCLKKHHHWVQARIGLFQTTPSRDPF